MWHSSLREAWLSMASLGAEMWNCSFSADQLDGVSKGKTPNTVCLKVFRKRQHKTSAGRKRRREDSSLGPPFLQTRSPKTTFSGTSSNCRAVRGGGGGGGGGGDRKTLKNHAYLTCPRGGLSSGGPRLAINCFHTYPPPYIFFHLPSSTLICFHHFSTFLSVHLIRFFIIIFPKCSPSFSPFSSPHSFHHIPLKMSFPQSPHLIHFKKRNFAKYTAKNMCHQKNIRTV